MTDDVTYRPVQGFPGYRVGDDGSVWTCWKRQGKKPAILGDSWRRLNPGIGDRYSQVRLSRDGKVYQRKVYHLVLEAFVGSRPENMEACHENGIKSDCRLCNLRWGTHSSNYDDRRRHGTGNEGEKSSTAKLKTEDINAILAELAAGESQSSIARRRRVTQSLISKIKLGQIWKHLRVECR